MVATRRERWRCFTFTPLTFYSALSHPSFTFDFIYSFTSFLFSGNANNTSLILTESQRVFDLKLFPQRQLKVMTDPEKGTYNMIWSSDAHYPPPRSWPNARQRTHIYGPLQDSHIHMTVFYNVVFLETCVYFGFPAKKPPHSKQWVHLATAICAFMSAMLTITF